MKILLNDGTERNETRPEILERHARMQREWEEKYLFLQTLQNGKPIYTFQGSTGWAAMAEEKRREQRAESQEEQGLTTEINTSTALISLRNTLDNVAELLRRHPYGYRDGDEEGSAVLTPENGGRAAVLTAEKADPYLNKTPKMKNGKLIWVEDKKA